MGVCYCPQVASEHVRKIFRTGEAIDEGAASVGMKTPGLNGLWREAEVWHHVAESESLRRSWVKVHRYCSGNPNMLEMTGQWSDHPGLQQVFRRAYEISYVCYRWQPENWGLSSPFRAQKIMSESQLSDVELLGLELHGWALALLKYDWFCALGLSLLFS